VLAAMNCASAFDTPLFYDYSWAAVSSASLKQGVDGTESEDRFPASSENQTGRHENSGHEVTTEYFVSQN